MRFLLEGPSLGLRAPSRFGKAGVFVRRLVYRLLRPYMVRQREFELALVRALAEVEEIARDEARRAVDTGQAATRKAHEALGRATRLDRELQAKSSDQRAALSALSPRIDEAESHLQRVEARLDEVASSGETVGPRIDEAETHLQRIGSHLQRIESQLAEVAAAGQTLEARLYAPPYTADATLLTTTDEEGRPAIGYRDGAGEQPLYLGFEDIFRGPEDFIRDRQRRYVELLRDHAPVLDVGCGRGELLGLLRDAGVVASGIDVDEGMVERARQTGANVEQADAIGYLEATPAGSLGAIVALQVIEHLPYRELLRFLELARERLVPGGVLVVETVNPHALEALKSFWVDLTHQAPIYPEVAVALCRLLGFDSAIVRFPNGSGELERDRREQGEYAVVATKAV
jgi:SAM-dependent methyltransferase